MNTKIFKLWPLICCLLATGCYEEEHFSFPGPYDTEGILGTDTLPNPFGKDRTEGHWLIKDGLVDYTQVATRGYTDFVPSVDVSTPSWYFTENSLACRPHYNPYAQTNAAHFDGDHLSYQCNDIYSRGLLETGTGKSWYVYARMSLNYMYNDLRSHFVISAGSKGWAQRANWGFNWLETNYLATNFLYAEQTVKGPLDNKYYSGAGRWSPGVPFEFEMICVNGVIHLGINGVYMWLYEVPDQYEAYPFMFRPWKNGARFYDLYIEGDYLPANAVAWSQENEYATIQEPALIRQGNDVLLFAEGRKENIQQTAAKNAVRSNATDIIMKRSTDKGDSWSKLSVVTGNDGSVNMQPSVINAPDGTLHLFYTTDQTGTQEGKNQIYHRSSADGNSWSEPQAIDGGSLSNQYIVSTVSGHGYCTGEGTMIVPVKYTLGRISILAMLTSRDGNTWKIGTPIPGERNVSCDITEVKGRLMCIMGQTGGEAYRTVSYSDDQGATWTPPEAYDVPYGTQGFSLDGAATQLADGSIVYFTPDNAEKGSQFNQSAPAADLGVDLKAQKFMYIKNSPDFATGLLMSYSDANASAWSEPANLADRTTFEGYVYRTGHMDAITLDNNTVICVYEGGMEVPYEGLLSYKKTF